MLSRITKPVRAMKRLAVPVPPRPANSGSSKRQQSLPWREGCPRAHFLHIGKTGGTAVKTALKPLVRSGPFDLDLHRHPFTLAKIPEGEVFFFCLRDPIERFVSGFSSRQREGRPRHYRPWGPNERLASAASRQPTLSRWHCRLAAAMSARRRSRRCDRCNTSIRCGVGSGTWRHSVPGNDFF